MPDRERPLEEIQEAVEPEVEFLGELEEVTAGWSGPTDDTIDGDWNW